MEKRMNFAEFIEFVANIKGCQFGNIELLTEVKMPKRGNPFHGRVQKHTITTIQFNYDYEKAVNNRLEKQGFERTFTSATLPWGTWHTANKVIEHNGNYYLRIYEVKNSKPNCEYFIDGKKATQEEYDLFKEFITERKSSEKQEEHGLKDENQVKPNSPKFENIKRITINGVTIVLD